MTSDSEAAPYLLAIDPGGRRKGTACAVFERRRLQATRMYRSTDCPSEWLSSEAGRVVVERPVYQGARTKSAHTGDLLDLAWEGAAVAYGIAAANAWPVVPVSPAEWKGSQHKPQVHARAWRVLDDDERRLLGGPRTEAVISSAVERGALERWKRPGGEYYPRTKAVGSLPDILDAVALGLVTLGRLL